LDLAVFEGARSGLLDASDMDQAGGAMEGGASAAMLLFENRWAERFVGALRDSGAELVAARYIPQDDSPVRWTPKASSGHEEGEGDGTVSKGRTNGSDRWDGDRRLQSGVTSTSEPVGAGRAIAVRRSGATGARGRPISRLKELAALKDQGILTEEEFAAQKAKILAWARSSQRTLRRMRI
jgi:hypothetical protein